MGLNTQDPPKRISVTITRPITVRQIWQYCQQLELEPAQVIALAMRGSLPPLHGGTKY